jgi:hypothetical protein
LALALDTRGFLAAFRAEWGELRRVRVVIDLNTMLGRARAGAVIGMLGALLLTLSLDGGAPIWLFRLFSIGLGGIAGAASAVGTELCLQEAPNRELFLVRGAFAGAVCGLVGGLIPGFLVGIGIANGDIEGAYVMAVVTAITGAVTGAPIGILVASTLEYPEVGSPPV